MPAVMMRELVLIIWCFAIASTAVLLFSRVSAGQVSVSLLVACDFQFSALFNTAACKNEEEVFIGRITDLLINGYSPTRCSLPDSQTSHVMALKGLPFLLESDSTFSKLIAKSCRGLPI